MSRGRALVSVMVAVAVVVVANLVINGGRGTNDATLPGGLAVPTDAESTGLYCTGFTGRSGPVPAAVEFANTSGEPRRVVASILTSAHESSLVSFTLAPGSTHRLGAGAFPGSAYQALSAQVSGSGVSASVVGAGDDVSVIPCATRGSRDWSTAGLSTVVGTTSVVTLLNPTSTTAIVDVTAVTPSGFEAPPSFQITLPANQLVTVNLGSQIVNEADVSASVTVRQGSVVAAAAVDWTRPTTGSAIVAGTPGPQRISSFPSVATNQDASATLFMANASAYPSTVTVRVKLGRFQISPFVVTVAADSVRDLALVPSGGVPAAGQAAVSVSSARPLAVTLQMNSSRGAGTWLVSPSEPDAIQSLLDPSGAAATISLANARAHAVSVTVDFVSPGGSAGHAASLTVTVPARSSIALTHSTDPTTRWSAVAVVSAVTPVCAAAERSGQPGGVRVLVGSGGR